MTNLIPPVGQKVIIREYWFRTLSVWAGLLTITILFAGVLLVPTFVLVKAQQQALAGQIANADQEEAKALEEDAAFTNAIATRIRAQEEDISFDEHIGLVSALASTDIQLNAITITRAEKDATKLIMRVEGVAASRGALQTFTSALERMPDVDAVDVPLSDLVRGVDVPFIATISFASKK